MFKSVSAEHPPLGDPGGFAHPFDPVPGFSLETFAGGGGVRSGQFFPEINNNLQCISIFSQCFREAIKNLRKNACFHSQ